MREYCLVKRKDGVVPSMLVLNMCLTGKPGTPELTDYQKGKGWEWVPASQVPQGDLQRYRYYNERP